MPCLQREDLDAAAARVQPPGQAFTLVCQSGCGGRLMFVDYLPGRRVIARPVRSRGAPAANPIVPEAAAAGGEVPISVAAPRGLAS